MEPEYLTVCKAGSVSSEVAFLAAVSTLRRTLINDRHRLADPMMTELLCHKYWRQRGQPHESSHGSRD